MTNLSYTESLLNSCQASELAQEVKQHQLLGFSNPYANVTNLPINPSTKKTLCNRVTIMRLLKETPIFLDNFLNTRMVEMDGQTHILTDAIIFKMAHRMEEIGLAHISTNLLRECVELHAHENQRDMMRSWLESLRWDGIDRCHELFYNYFGTESNDYTRAVSTYFCSAMAARAYDGHAKHGIQVDSVPALIGAQGLNKSTSIRALAPHAEYFGRLDFHLADADRARLTQGKTIVELAELRGLRSKDDESIKSYIDLTCDKWIPKFREHEQIAYRRFVMIATTNDDGFLADTTGNRRWLPLNVGRRCDVEGIKTDCAQIWAQAFQIYQNHGVLWQGVEELARPHLDDFMVYDPRIEKIHGILADQPNKNAWGSAELWEEAYPHDRFGQKEGHILRNAMVRIKGWQKKKIWLNNKAVLGWVKTSE